MGIYDDEMLSKRVRLANLINNFSKNVPVRSWSKLR